MYRKVFVLAIVLVTGLLLADIGLKVRKSAQAAEPATKTDMPWSEVKPSGMQGMTEKGQMMRMCPMHRTMIGSIMSISIAPTEDGGVIVLAGDKLIKYDKDLNLVKEVQVAFDTESAEKKMCSMIENCPMCKGMMQGGGMMKRGSSNWPK